VSVVNNQQLAYIHGISISQTLTSELEHYWSVSAPNSKFRFPTVTIFKTEQTKELLANVLSGEVCKGGDHNLNKPVGDTKLCHHD